MALFTGTSASCGPCRARVYILVRSPLNPSSSITTQLVPQNNTPKYREDPCLELNTQLVLTMKFTLLFMAFARMVFSDAFNFPTAGCVDEAGTTACLAQADSAMAASCSTVCGCTDPFTCSHASDACLAGCVCVATQTYLNCVLSSCWNKVCYALARQKPSLTQSDVQVYSCEYQTLAVDAVNICPIAVPAGIPYFLSNPNQPGSCSCELSALWAASTAAPLTALNCTKINFKAAASQQCACCAVEESISA